MRTLPFHIAHFHDRPRPFVAVKYILPSQSKSNTWVSLNWADYQFQIKSVFFLLKNLNLTKDRRVVIFAPSRFEWAVCDLACLCSGVLTIPIYSNSSKEEVEFILGQAEPDLILIGDQEQFDKLPSDILSSEKIKILSFSPIKTRSSKEIELLQDALNGMASAAKDLDSESFTKACLKISLEDEATIVYTSGTSGKPKGVVLTHRQIMSEVTDIMTAFPITSSDTTLSFLPYAHILGRVEMWLNAYAGFTLAFAESIDRIRINLLDIQPTVLISVPRIFEKIHSSVVSRLNSSFVAQSVQTLEQKGFWFSLASTPLRMLLKREVANKLHEAFGGKLKYAISGGAPLSREIADFFRDKGLLLLEGYGLTETTGAICVNTPNEHRFGTVGKPLADVNIKLDDDGEILVKSDKVCHRYFKNSEDSPVDEDGYFHTGDIGEFTKGGFLRITDRKKDLIKTSGGKYVAPQRIESLFKRNPLISQVLIHGDQRKFIVALVTLDPSELKSLALRLKIPFSRVQDLLTSQRVQTEVERIVKEVNQDLASFETIKKFKILPNEFSIATGELTPSLKLKRKFCEEKYKDVLDKLYGM